MNIGMLWFNNDPKMSLEQKVKGAAAYYLAKYGKVANMVFVHPAQFVPGVKVEGVEIKASRSVLPNHLWIGEQK